MILLDTHIWIWWVQGDSRLSADLAEQLKAYENDGLGISAISYWEVAKLVQYQRIHLPCDIDDWMDQALAYPGIQRLELTPAIAIESTQLPGTFHRDPADQIIVATARVHQLALMTLDQKILDYSHVETLN